MGGVVKFVHISQRRFFFFTEKFSHGYENVESSFLVFHNVQWKSSSRKSFVFWPVIYRIAISHSHSGRAHKHREPK